MAARLVAGEAGVGQPSVNLKSVTALYLRTVSVDYHEEPFRCRAPPRKKVVNACFACISD